MASGQRPRSLPTLFLVLLSISILSSRVVARSADISQDDWSRILTNNDGLGPCELQKWMAGPACTHVHRDDEDVRQRRALVYNRDVGGAQPSQCTCTLAFFNVACGCLLSHGQSLDTVNYTDWQNQCRQNGLDTNADHSWMSSLGETIPPWTFIALNNGTFDAERVRESALAPETWSLIQIIAPIIASTAILVLLGIMFIYWRRYRRLKKEGKKPGLPSYITSPFAPRAQRVRPEGRNSNWRIDNDGHPDDESIFMVPRPTDMVSSPVEISHWSPSTMSPISSPPARGNRLTFTPRRPSKLSVEQGVLAKATFRSISDRMKDIMPWKRRPAPVVNRKPSSHYDIDRSSQGSKSRRSTLSTRKGSLPAGRGRYTTILEEDDDVVGPARREGGGIRVDTRMDRRSYVTDEDRRAVADSVLLIRGEDPNFTVESGSSNAHGTPTPSRSARAATGIRTGTGNTRDPAGEDRSTLSFSGFQLVPPSPTLDLHQTLSPKKPPPESPGPPPLMPPPPIGPAPDPPIIRRPTPRRTPPPEATPSGARVHYRDTSAPNLSAAGPSSTAPYMHRALRPSPPESSQVSLKNQFTQLQSQPGSSSQSLSYASLHQHTHSESSLNVDRNIHGETPEGGSRSRSNSGSRPLPPQPRPPPQVLSHQSSNTSMGELSILHTPKGSDSSGRPKSPSRRDHPRDQPEFDPYAGFQRLPGPPQPEPSRRSDAQDARQKRPHRRPHPQPQPKPQPQPQPQPRTHPQPPSQPQPQRLPPQHQLQDQPHPHQHFKSPSSTTLPRAPGDGGGQHQRGWSASDDESSVLMHHAPMDVGSVSARQVYLATPQDVEFRDGRHVRNISNESFMTASDFGGEQSAEGEGGMLGVQASFGGRQSVSGSSGWEASTEENGGGGGGPSFHHGSGALTPRNREMSRSREDLLVPTKNDPAMLFPGVVRAEGYMTRLPPDAIPTPTPSPRPNGRLNAPMSHNAGTSAGAVEGAGRYRESRGGGGWGTQSSGVQSVYHEPELYPPLPSSTKWTPR